MKQLLKDEESIKAWLEQHRIDNDTLVIDNVWG